MIARLRDWLLERRIASLQFDISCEHLRYCGSVDYLTYLNVALMYRELGQLEDQRSPQQLARTKGRGE